METITLLKDKRIVLGVTGSIAAYKAVDVASKLTQAGAFVDVIMTESAQRFVTPLTFQAVTGRAVYTDMWQTGGGGLPTHIAHVGLAESADLLAVVPATAHSLSKLAHGNANDLLSVTAVASTCPVLVAPAMDGNMYAHIAVKDNIATLEGRGVKVISPDVGRFASGLVGKGRLPTTETIIGHMRGVLGRKGTLRGVSVILTAGGTREALDPVRYLTNRSSGKQGYAVAQAAIDAGASVTLITTAADKTVPIGADVVHVDSAQSMHDAVLDHLPYADVIIMAAAVADFRPATIAEQKIKKTDDSDDLSLPLVRTPDILMRVMAERQSHPRLRAVVGFAAESENLLANAQAKRQRKGLELLVANDISAPDAGFAVDTNRVTLLHADGRQEPLELTSKARVGEAIIERVAALLS